MNRLPELLSNTVSTFMLPVALVMIVLGTLCVVAGHKFYWLAAGLSAFMATYIAVSNAFSWPAWQHLLASGIAGVLVALITIALQRMSFALNSFFIFGLLISIISTRILSFDGDSFTPVVIFFVAGSAAAFFNLTKPNNALIYTTAFIGGLAITCGLLSILHQVPNPIYIAIVWIALGVAGSIFQTRNIERKRRENSLS